MLDIRNCDNMDLMREFPDNYFDWAIVDPMYDLPENYLVPGTGVTTCGVKRGDHETAKKLSALPIVGYDYYNEVVRVSKNQIIWGINYFPFAGEVCGRIVWDKKNDSSTFSNCELASCSSIKGTRIFRYLWNGFLQQDMKNKEQRTHPFQKPIALYKWLLERYTVPEHKILDTNLGSGTIAIACHDLGRTLIACELVPEIYESAMKRINAHVAQQKLFI